MKTTKPLQNQKQERSWAPGRLTPQEIELYLIKNGRKNVY